MEAVVGKRTCGTCTLCCKVMGIKELKKERNRWCPHSGKTCGCSIYDMRPASCREFECAWLQNPSLSDAFRPDKVHGFFTDLQGVKDGLALHLDPGYPLAHLQEPLAGFLRHAEGKRVRVVVICGKKLYYRHPLKGWVLGVGVATDGEKTTAEIPE